MTGRRHRRNPRVHGAGANQGRRGRRALRSVRVGRDGVRAHRGRTPMVRDGRICPRPGRQDPHGRAPAASRAQATTCRVPSRRRSFARSPRIRTRALPSMADVADALEPFASQSTGGGERVAHCPSARRSDRVRGDHPCADERARLRPSFPRTPRTRPRRIRRRASGRCSFRLRHGCARGRRDPRAPRTSRRFRPAPRALSTVPEAEAAFKEARSLLHDGVDSKVAPRWSRRSSSIHVRRRASRDCSPDAAGRPRRRASSLPERLRASRDASPARRSAPRRKRALRSSEARSRRMGNADDVRGFQFPRDPELQLFLARESDKATTKAPRPPTKPPCGWIHRTCRPSRHWPAPSETSGTSPRLLAATGAVHEALARRFDVCRSSLSLAHRAR